jgi:DNA processing protein
VPGEITSALSAGSNALLRLGATPATCGADVLEAIGVEASPAAPVVLDDPAAAAIVDALSSGAATQDELVRAIGLPAGAVAAALVELELAGAVSIGEGVVRSTIAR